MEDIMLCSVDITHQTVHITLSLVDGTHTHTHTHTPHGTYYAIFSRRHTQKNCTYQTLSPVDSTQNGTCYLQ